MEGWLDGVGGGIGYRGRRTVSDQKARGQVVRYVARIEERTAGGWEAWTRN